MKTEACINSAILLLSLFVAHLATALAPVTTDDAKQIAVDTYIYAYPLVLMDITRKVQTNTIIPDTRTKHAPMNQFYHAPDFPDATFTDVVRANADTLYSFLWFDVSKEPLIIDVPDSGGRYYLLPMLDMWTDIFASPGKRTSGTEPQTYAITGPSWRGELPAGVTDIKAPTSEGWIIGRTQTNGKRDYDNVHKFQAGLKAIPLGEWRKKRFEPRKGVFDARQNMSAPVEQIEKMSAPEFFAKFAELMKLNPPHSNDYSILQQMARLGIVPGKSFDLAKISPDAKTALEAAAPTALAKIKSYAPHASVNALAARQTSAHPFGPIGRGSIAQRATTRSDFERRRSSREQRARSWKIHTRTV